MKLFTDFASDLSEKTAEQEGIILLPAGSGKSRSREAEAKEQDETEKEEQKEREARFLKLLLPYAERGEEILYCASSSKLFDGYETAARLRADLGGRYPDFRFWLIDSREFSLGLSLPMLQAAQHLRDGWAPERVINTLLFDCAHIKLILTIEDASRLWDEEIPWAGHAAFEINPLFEVDSQGGVSLVKKVHGRARALEELTMLAGQYGSCLLGQTVGVFHTGCPEEAGLFANELKERYEVREVITAAAGKTVTERIGKNAVGAVFRY